jgi:hypothetical protein
MSLWKRIKEKRSEKTAKEQGGRQAAVRPHSALIWIDAVYSDLPARVARGLAIAEAFCAEGVEKVTLACLQSRNLPDEADRRGAHWLDSRPNGAPITFNEIVKTAEADLVIADSSTPPRLQSDLKVPLFVLLADAFSPNLLEPDSIKALLLPGLILPPDFETLRLLPNRIGDCIHGPQYVPIPSAYATDGASAPQEDRVLIALSGNGIPETLTQLLETVKRSWSGEITVLADVSAGAAQKIQEIKEDRVEFLIDPPLSERLSAMRRAKLALAYPSLTQYELLALKKPVILMPRNEGEIQLCRLVLEAKAARAVPASESQDALSLCLEELLKSDEGRKKLSAGAGELIPANGAKNIMDSLLARFERTGGSQKAA